MGTAKYDDLKLAQTCFVSFQKFVSQMQEKISLLANGNMPIFVQILLSVNRSYIMCEVFMEYREASTATGLIPLKFT